MMDGDVMEPAPGAEELDEHRREIVKEAMTMALYVAICLLAALAVAAEADVDHRRTVLAVIWGTSLGLAVAHWFAFRLSTRIVAAGAVPRSEAELAVAQLFGSVAVAVLATIPALLVDGPDAEFSATGWILVAFIALVGFFVARGSGASAVRSIVYGVTVTIVAAAVVLVKNALGH